jgi:hypothetical protein
MLNGLVTGTSSRLDWLVELSRYLRLGNGYMIAKSFEN